MDEEFEDEPRSGEAKSPAYPAGPVCIFEPNVYLFAEPDAKLASEFDVVINVAREVLNPPINTPKVTGSGKTEYIHISWDHNTPIVDELPDLVKIIKDRVTGGKKVLVHCQCGVSRSASLLIAYALFMKPEQTVQEAYDTVKRRSKWIGPNMSLIFQLLEWKKRLGK
ncbi:dual specificity phosphatase, partial [Terfezia claveryi]